MKIKTYTAYIAATALTIAFFASNLSAQTSSEKPGTSPKTGLGITDVFDEEIHINHNQLFKKTMADNPVKADGALLLVDLVEHPSQATIAIGALIGRDALITSLYKGGKLLRKDTIRIARLETSRQTATPAFSIASSDEGIVITNLSAQSEEYKNGLRNGFILKAVDYTPVFAGQEDAVMAMLEGDVKRSVSLKVTNLETSETFYFTAKRYTKTLKEWVRPLGNNQVQWIFEAMLNVLAAQQTALGITFQNPKQFNTTSIFQVRDMHNGGKCFAQDQLSVAEKSRRHYLEPGIKLDSIFKKEIFYSPRTKSKKALPGDAALNVMRYYNYDQEKSHLIVNDYIDDEMKTVVRKLSGPYFNKPGVFANYFIAGKEYENARNYQAALNQYYASLRKVDEIIASEMVKTRAKSVVLGRIAYCAKQLNQVQYASLVSLAQDCLKLTLKESSLSQSDKNFYEFSNKTLKLCTDIESKLKEQRTKKAIAIVGAVASAGMGVASFNFDPSLAGNLLLNAADIMDKNTSLNMQLNASLIQTTGSINFKLPAELQDEESSPYEILASSYINFALESAQDKTAILDKIEQYAANNASLKQEVQEAREHYAADNNLNHSALIAHLLNTEKIVYRYEKRGLAVPERAMP